ncbi:hypothetical protein R1sor_016075 [Riccia sorocarpa]|uniref:Endonuclease/exonuclease/phosphatase domain-containing protein n=1 Tax=Riccia sorocarpa TaxID=122646 RepID=A0ABD3HFZ0_9MARC
MGSKPRRLHRHLRKTGFIRLGDTFAATNVYGPFFDDADPSNLNQIITVLVHKADRFISTAIDEILGPVGKVLHSFVEPHGTNSTLKAVTLFSRPKFITELEVPITPQINFTLKLDYEGLQLRCRLCLSVQHSAQDCPHRLRSPRQQLPPNNPVRAREEPLNGGDRSIDLNEQPPRSRTAPGRQNKCKKQVSDSDSDSLTGSSIKHYQELQHRETVQRRVQTPSISNSTADTPTERGRSTNSRRRESQLRPDTRPPANTVTPSLNNNFGGHGILPLPGIPLSQGITLQTSAHTTFNRVYSAYIPPPIAAITNRPTTETHNLPPNPAQAFQLLEVNRGKKEKTFQFFLLGALRLLSLLEKMKIVLATYNVRGLCSRLARTQLKNLIRTCRPSFDVLAIQEHKLREQNIDFLTSSLWSQATIFNLPATDGIHAERNPSVIGGKGGVLLAVSPKLAPLIVNNGILPSNGGIWIHLDLIDGTRLGIAAIYAPHTAAERALLWASMEATLDISRKWTLLPPHLTKKEERRGQLRLPTDSGRVLKRLDRIYTDSSLLRNPYSSEIITASELSDHLPAVTTLHLGAPPTASKKTNYRMNTAALHDLKLRDHLSILWRKWEQKYVEAGIAPLQALKACIKRSAKFC